MTPNENWENTDTTERGESLHGFIIPEGILLLSRDKEPNLMDRRKHEVVNITAPWDWSTMKSEGPQRTIGLETRSVASEDQSQDRTVFENKPKKDELVVLQR